MNAFALSLIVAALGFADAHPPRADVLVVVGAPGTDEYAKDFQAAAEAWRGAAERGGAECETFGLAAATETSDREQFHKALEAKVAVSDRGPLWIVFLGHGTDDGRDAKFNLRGPDVTAEELKGWLAGATRPIAIINCSSASGRFINALSGPDRVVVTATRSGDEVNYSRFGGHLASAIGDAASDLDKDEQVSLLEAFLMASGRVAEFYREEARLATEHALLDDNGDALGTPAEWFVGVRATKRAKDGATLDGARAHQLHLVPSAGERELPEEARQRRDELETEINALRERKGELGEEAYYAELDKLMVELATLYQASATP